MLYREFDYLAGFEPYYIADIGTLRSPTLKDIRKITYNIFALYIKLLNMDVNEFLEEHDFLKDAYASLNDEDKKKNDIFQLLITFEAPLILSLIAFFVKDHFEYNPKENRFDVYQKVETESNVDSPDDENNNNAEKKGKADDDKKSDEENLESENADPSKKYIGHIGQDNFEQFRTEIKLILGLVDIEDVDKPKFKNALAEKMFSRMKEHSKQKTKEKVSSGDDTYSLENMIRKYCTHNKVGINILNVWDMTYYQFIQMFEEYTYARQCDFNDAMGANTFSYKNSRDYKPELYMKTLKKKK